MTVNNRGTLCFLHGWGFDKRVWASFAEGFFQEWKVKIPALTGYDGTTSRVLVMDDVARTLLSEIPDDSIVIGWSLGGMIGIRIAAMKPIRKLILLASTPCFVKKNDWSCGTEAEIINRLMQRIKIEPDRALREFAMLGSRGDSSPRATYQTLAGFLEKNNAHTGALIDGLEMLMRTDLRKEFPRIKCRVGAILAEKDQLVPVASAKAMRTLRPGLELEVVESAGHAPFISRPEQTRRLLLSMLAPEPIYE